HFTWQMAQMNSSRRGVSQSAYRIVVADPQNNIAWDSKKLPSGEALNIAYDGAALKPATRYTWKVTVWDQDGKQVTGESWFETGLMNPDPNLSAWDGATWIGGATEDLPLYAQYSSIYKLNYTLKINPGSNRASFITGANDPRLTDRNKN